MKNTVIVASLLNLIVPWVIFISRPVKGVSDHDLLFSRQAKDEAPSAEEGRSIIQELEGELAGHVLRIERFYCRTSFLP